jgi:hypothetical protein
MARLSAPLSSGASRFVSAARIFVPARNPRRIAFLASFRCKRSSFRKSALSPTSFK